MTQSSQSKVEETPPAIENSASSLSEKDWQAQFRSRTLYCLKDSLDQYQDQIDVTLQPELQPLIGQLKTLNQKIVQNALQIAVFGYVSRGKSALLNALLGEPILATGALNGVTQWPRSIQWQPFADENIEWKIELVDTPGLGEVDGDDRAQMAITIAQASDLLLFVVAGKPNETEQVSLQQLHATGKPILLISNKADLYPDLTAEGVWATLTEELQHWIQPTDILLTAANPAARKVRNEWPDGHVTEEWEVPPSNIESVRDRLKRFLTRDAFISVMQNVLEQTEHTQNALEQIVFKNHLQDSQELQRRYVLFKLIAIGILPVWWLDGPVNLILDLLLVRSLVNLYALPTTRHNVEALWRTIFFSLFGVLLCEMLSGLGLGIGSAVGDGLFNIGGILLWGSTAVLQAMAAAYGAQKVGTATQSYLLEGVTWSPQGASQLLLELNAVQNRTAS